MAARSVDFIEEAESELEGGGGQKDRQISAAQRQSSECYAGESTINYIWQVYVTSYNYSMCALVLIMLVAK